DTAGQTVPPPPRLSNTESPPFGWPGASGGTTTSNKTQSYSYAWRTTSSASWWLPANGRGSKTSVITAHSWSATPNSRWTPDQAHQSATDQENAGAPVERAGAL